MILKCKISVKSGVQKKTFKEECDFCEIKFRVRTQLL